MSLAFAGADHRGAAGGPDAVEFRDVDDQAAVAGGPAGVGVAAVADRHAQALGVGVGQGRADVVRVVHVRDRGGLEGVETGVVELPGRGPGGVARADEGAVEVAGEGGPVGGGDVRLRAGGRGPGGGSGPGARVRLRAGGGERGCGRGYACRAAARNVRRSMGPPGGSVVGDGAVGVGVPWCSALSARRVLLRVRARLASRSSRRASPAAGAVGHAEAALLRCAREVFRPVLLRHADHVTHPR